MSLARDIQTSVWDAECRHDIDTLLEHFHHGAVFHPAGAPAQRGHDAIRRLTEEFYRVYPTLEIELLDEFGDGHSSAAFEFRAHLTDVDGQRSTLEGVCLVQIEEGAFTSVRYYEDAPVVGTR